MHPHRVSYQLHLFTLRLWQERMDTDLFEWRGEVKNVRTGEVRYFRSAASLYHALLVLLDAPSQELERGDGGDAEGS
jgi:hypothetical protein